WNTPELREALEKVLPEKSQFQNFEVTHRFERIGRKIMLLNAREMELPAQYGKLILVAIDEVTARRRADIQLIRMNEDLKHFAYAASHDLQEPLRMVTSYSQLLAKEYKAKLDGGADQYIFYIVEGAQRMHALLKGMREYWQVSGPSEGHHASLDCNEILRKVLADLEEAITKSRAVVTHDPLPTVWAEEAPLIQLFQNLVGNAIKYRSEKKPKVHLSAVKNDNGEWVFSIKDNGIGIEPQYSQKIFSMFNRLNGGRYPGSGIGLAMCQKIVERLGGRIWVESKLGKGADFKFTIPPRG
ncbi:MAG: ATP-binding protein, partial [Bryobacteraceae bacterium]